MHTFPDLLRELARERDACDSDHSQDSQRARRFNTVSVLLRKLAAAGASEEDLRRLVLNSRICGRLDEVHQHRVATAIHWRPLEAAILGAFGLLSPTRTPYRTELELCELWTNYRGKPWPLTTEKQQAASRSIRQDLSRLNTKLGDHGIRVQLHQRRGRIVAETH